MIYELQKFCPKLHFNELHKVHVKYISVIVGIFVLFTFSWYQLSKWWLIGTIPATLVSLLFVAVFYMFDEDKAWANVYLP